MKLFPPERNEFDESKFHSLARIREDAENALYGRLERALNLTKAVWAIVAGLVIVVAGASFWIANTARDVEAVRKNSENNTRLIRQLYKESHGIEP